MDFFGVHVLYQNSINVTIKMNHICIMDCYKGLVEHDIPYSAVILFIISH